jgi:hypothetical protein
VSVVLAILAVLIALILIVFFTPVRITLDAAGGPRPERFELWLWGWRVYRWRPGEKPPEQPERPEKEPKPKRETGRGGLPSGDRIGPIFKLLFGKSGRRLAARMVRSISILEGRLHVLFGLDDPAWTGLVAGPAYALNAYLGAAYLELEPDFTEAVFALDGRITVESSLARLSGPPLRFIFEPGAARALWILANGPADPKPQPQTQTPR